MELPASLCEGRYTLVEPLGEGGMATVYRAYDHRLKVWRALKLLSAEYGRKKKLRARFDAEAQTMANLEHPHIVRVYDVGTEGDQPYIVMELCEGGSPTGWLDQHGPMPPRLAVEVVLQLCDGIAAAHAAGVIHRDIKPHNVLVTSKGACKVTDFGIAQISDTDVKSALTKTGTVMGTLGFMAPEQRLDAKGVDVRADVYAIGATLYTLLTNRTNMDLFAAEQDDEVLADVHPALRPILITAVQYKRDQRYPTVQALSAALRAALPELPADPADTPPLAQPAPPPPPIPTTPTLVADVTPVSNKMPVAPTILPEVAPEPPANPTQRARLKPRSTAPTPAPAQERSLSNLPFPKEEPRRAPTPARAEGEAEPAPVASRAAQMLADGPTPDYVVDAPNQARNQHYTIELADGEQGRRDKPPGDEQDDDEEDGAAKVDASGDGFKDLVQFALQILLAILQGLAYPAKMVAGPFALIGGAGVIMLWLGATSVNSAQTYAMQVQVAYSNALREDMAPAAQVVIDAGGAEHLIAPALQAYQEAATEEARLDAATRLIDILKEQAAIPRVSTAINTSGQRGDYNKRMERLEALKREQETARGAWEEAANSTRGGWAVGCGVSDAPPPRAVR
jgi:serine/threonine protein kinase